MQKEWNLGRGRQSPQATKLMPTAIYRAEFQFCCSVERSQLLRDFVCWLCCTDNRKRFLESLKKHLCLQCLHGQSNWASFLKRLLTSVHNLTVVQHTTVHQTTRATGGHRSTDVWGKWCLACYILMHPSTPLALILCAMVQCAVTMPSAAAGSKKERKKHFTGWKGFILLQAKGIQHCWVVHVQANTKHWA